MMNGIESWRSTNRITTVSIDPAAKPGNPAEERPDDGGDRRHQEPNRSDARLP